MQPNIPSSQHPYFSEIVECVLKLTPQNIPSVHNEKHICTKGMYWVQYLHWLLLIELSKQIH